MADIEQAPDAPKDTVLLLIKWGSMSLYAKSEAISIAQRDADWQVVEPLIQALKRIRDSQEGDLGTYAKFCFDEAHEALRKVGIK